MAFIDSGETLTVTAKLTAIGRQKILLNSSNLITHFALGDSDANYYSEYVLSAGTIPVLAGDLSSITTSANTMDNNFQLRSKLIRNTQQDTKKLVESSSPNVIAEHKWVGEKSLSGSSLYFNIVDRTVTSDDASRPGNWFKTFGLPITSADKSYFTNIPYSTGFLNTALSGVNRDRVLVIGLPKDQFGEVIDGKSVYLTLTDTGGTSYDIYGTYQNTYATNSQTQDNNLIETSPELKFTQNSSNPQLVGYNRFGNNVTFLFSDDIAYPNQDATKSWATGYNTYKPYTLNSKEQFNLITNSNASKTADTAIGIAYLDKGFIVITDPNIVENFDTTTSGASATTITFNSVTTEVSQKVTCLAKRGEFGDSTNNTFDSSAGDVPRVTEIALMDSSETVIAVAKLDRQYALSQDMFLAVGVKIIL